MSTLLGAAEFAEASGLTERQMDYWPTVGILLPAVAAHGQGSRRRWEPGEARVARVVQRISGFNGQRSGGLLARVAEVVRGGAPWVRIGDGTVTGVDRPDNDGAVYLSTAEAS